MRMWMTIAMLLVAGCFDPKFASDLDCDGVDCPDGYLCVTRKCVLFSDITCGNGILDPGEECDDRNFDDGDGCSQTCRLEICGNGIADPGELCDDGNTVPGDGCSADCRSVGICGDGVIDHDPAGNALEACDDGNTVSGDGCNADCTSNEGCGNGFEDPGEECDDGNLVITDSCVNCRNARCGDGIIASGIEECDDGNAVTETSCPYGTASCTTCDASCHDLPTTGNVCGDGVVDPIFESCDDHNALVCGSCTADCHTLTTAHAVGLIVPAPGSGLNSGDTFTLDDGIDPPTTFEFTNGAPGAGRVAIGFLIGDTNAAIKARLIAAINGVGGSLLITASAGNGTIVQLIHDLPTTRGNQPISSTVASPNFQVVGMSGGEGGDCAAGDGCGNADDCESHDCDLGTHTCN